MSSELEPEAADREAAAAEEPVSDAAPSSDAEPDVETDAEGDPATESAVEASEPTSEPELERRGPESQSAYRDVATTKPLVVIREVRKSFLHMGRALEVLKGIDLEIHEGEIVAIVGKSGAGKSTLLQCIGTLDMPSTGIIRLGEHYLVGLSRAELARIRNRMIGFVFQFHHLLPEFNALENVMMPGLIQGLPRDTVEKRARSLLTDVGLEHRVTHRPGELSGGEQQRVALARALLLEPKLILADEPSGNLDTGTSDAIHELFFDINQKHGTTIVVVTHNTKLAESMPRIIRMLDGKVEQDSDPPRTRFEVDRDVLDRSRALAKVRYAGFWTRAGARIMDFALYIVIGNAVSWLVGAMLTPMLVPALQGDAALASGLSPLFHPLAVLGILLGSGVLTLVAHGIGEWIGGGATIGKLLFGLRVRMENLDRPRLGPALLRNVLVTVDGLFIGLVAYLGIRSSLLRQRFGDGLAQTVVIDSRTIPDGEGGGGAFAGIAVTVGASLLLHFVFFAILIAVVLM